MSSFERLVSVGALAAALLAFSGCGYHPLYAERRTGPGVTAELAGIRVAPIADRSGQMLRNLLMQRLDPSGTAAAADYRLEVSLGERKVEVGIRQDEVATRANLILNARFALYDEATGRQAFSGRAISTNSYNILRNDFATLSAEKDARERGIQQISEDIQTRLAVFLGSRRASAGAGGR